MIIDFQNLTIEVKRIKFSYLTDRHLINIINYKIRQGLDREKNIIDSVLWKYLSELKNRNIKLIEVNIIDLFISILYSITEYS